MNMEVRPPSRIPDAKAFSTVEVVRVKHWHEYLFSFSVTRPESFRFRSGEFTMLGMQIEDKPLMRAYSIASPAYADEIEFLSVKVPDGPLTSQLQRIRTGDQLYLGRKPTGTLVADALLPGRRLFLLATGTGLAPFLSIIRDPEIYDAYSQIILVHSVRHVEELAFRNELEAQLAGDPLVQDQALIQFHYVPTVTREEFRTTGRIQQLIGSEEIFSHPVVGPNCFDPEQDRIMLCGSMEMIKQFSEYFESLEFTEGSNAAPGQFVIERAFVG